MSQRRNHDRPYHEDPTCRRDSERDDRCDRCGCGLEGKRSRCRRHPGRCHGCDRCGGGACDSKDYGFWNHFGRHDCKGDENLEAIGSLPAMQYWNDLVSVSLSAWTDATMQAIGMWQRTVLCRYNHPGELACDVAELWRDWSKGVVSLAEFPFEWHARRNLSTPSLVFIVDEAAQTTVPQSAPAAINAGGLAVYATDLQMISGTDTIGSEHVQVELLEHGNRVQVTLVNLGGVLALGRYVGVAYAYEHPHRLPLALVYLFVVPNGVIQPAPPPADDEECDDDEGGEGEASEASK